MRFQFRSFCLLLFLFNFVLGVFVQAHELSDAEATLVVYNENEPRSEEIAQHYSQKRNIPKDHLLGISCPNKEEITREEYDKTILHPIREFVKQENLISYGTVPSTYGRLQLVPATSNALRFMVLCYGIPLKIAYGPQGIIPEEFKGLRKNYLATAAAVDSELANLPTLKIPTVHFLENPIYEQTFAQTKDWNLRMICVARLDGPTPEIARNLVDDAVQAEHTGLYGRCFFDMRGLTEADGEYQKGDDWIRESKELFKKQHWEIVSDNQRAIFDENVHAKNCAIYAGWYVSDIAGAFKAASFRFRTGAIAYHLHSGSATSLRTSTRYWTGPLLARGVAATIGCVYEPFIEMTPHINVLFQRLLEGCSFGEAAYSCQRYISWMNTVVGDPLYRPFAISNENRIKDFESRLQMLSEDEKTALTWARRLKK